MSIRCPKCQKSTSIVNLEADLALERCDACKGYWMDKGELERTTVYSADFPTPEIKDFSKSKFFCPKCESLPLYRVPFAQGKSTMIDICKSCHGFWLDSGELGKVQDILKDHRIEQKKRRLEGL